MKKIILIALFLFLLIPIASAYEARYWRVEWRGKTDSTYVFLNELDFIKADGTNATGWTPTLWTNSSSITLKTCVDYICIDDNLFPIADDGYIQDDGAKGKTNTWGLDLGSVMDIEQVLFMNCYNSGIIPNPRYIAVFSSSDNLTWSLRQSYGNAGIDAEIQNGTYGNCDLLNVTSFKLPTPPSVNAAINVLFTNETDKILYKNNFKAGEDIIGYVNWTYDDNNSAINFLDGGKCNITMINGLLENQSSKDNFSLCQIGCDYDTFKENFTFHDVTNVIEDELYANYCHLNLPLEDITLSYSCGVNVGIITIDKSEFPSCVEGYANLRKNLSGNCLAETLINISIDNTANLNKGHRIEILSLDKTYSSHLFNYDDGDVLYNSTSLLWYTKHPYEYYIGAIYYTYANCSDTITNSSINVSLEIENAPPRIFFSGMNNSVEFYNNRTSLIFKYRSSNWSWFGSVVDDDLDYFNVFWTNSTGDILQQNNSLTNTSELKTPSTLFRDFANPYYLNIIAIDEAGNVTEAHFSFNITDLDNPYCTGLINSTVENNTFYNWSLSCYDESFYSFEINCTGSDYFNYSREGLDLTVYQFINATTIYEITSCAYEYCDGHTALNIGDMIITDQDKQIKRTIDDKIIFESPNVLKTFNFNKKDDRYNFEISYGTARNNLSFNITSDEFIHIMSQEKYLGWLVTGNYWIDFESDLINKAIIKRISNNVIQIELFSKKPFKDITFNSIGKLNCVSGSITLTPVGSVSFFTWERFDCDISSTGKAIFIVGMMFFMFALWVFCIISKIPILNILIGFFQLYFAWNIATCFQFANVIWIIMGIMQMLLGIYYWSSNRDNYFGSSKM